MDAKVVFLLFQTLPITCCKLTNKNAAEENPGLALALNITRCENMENDFYHSAVSDISNTYTIFFCCLLQNKPWVEFRCISNVTLRVSSQMVTVVCI